MQHNYLFIDRDGTLIEEPDSQQVDSLDKLKLMPGVIHALYQLQQAGFVLVLISNQDGLGTAAFPQADFDVVHNRCLHLFNSQGIVFSDQLICPHLPSDHCACRKPKLGLVMDYLIEQRINRRYSYVIGDRDTDVQLAEQMGITGLLLGSAATPDWPSITDSILKQARTADLYRQTNETKVRVILNADGQGQAVINSGSAFFDHMLSQIAVHGQLDLNIQVTGDWVIDDHHSIEDTALVLGQALRQAIGDKRGIGRYGFWLPMDEASCKLTLDLSGRPFYQQIGTFPRDEIGGVSTEMISHFFYSLSQSLAASIHVVVAGDNTHHMIESAFKALGRALRLALAKTHQQLPSSKGCL